MTDFIPPAEPPSFLKRNTGEIVAIAAFVLSLTVSMISAWYAVRGSEVVLLPPDRVILYRDNLNGDATARLALPLSLINTASADHGDVVVKVMATIPVGPKREPAAFAFNALVEPVLTETADKAAEACDLGARCLALPSLLIIDRDARLLDVPGGGARSHYVAFDLARWNCTGTPTACDPFANFTSAVAALGARSLDVTMDVQLYSDGKKQAACRTVRAIDGGYLAQTGWISLTCTSLSSSAP